MIYGYLLISENSDEVEAQKRAINEYALKHDFEVKKFIRDNIYGNRTISLNKLYTLLCNLTNGDTLLVSDFDCLGRHYFTAIEIFKICAQRGVKLINVSQDLIVGENYDPASLVYAFTLCNDVSINIISKKTIKGQVKAKEKGYRIGRPSGSRNKKTLVEENIEKIKAFQAKGYSGIHIAKLIGIHQNTLYAGLKELKAQGKL